MKTLPFSLLAGLLFIAGNSTLAYAVEDEQAKQAEQHLEKAIESGKTGDTKTEASQIDQAEKNMIQEDKDKPFPEPIKQITGENPKAEHDKAAFDAVEKAKAYAKSGHAKQAADAAKKAEIQIQEKALTK